MDKDIHENLKEVSAYVQALGRQVGSPKIDIAGLRDMSESLKLASNTIETYIRIQINRYSD